MGKTRRPRRRPEDIVRSPLGQRIFEKRTELGYTQEYVAEMIGAPQSWAGKLELGDIQFGDPARMRALARLLNLDYDELLVLSGMMDRYATARAFAATLPSEDQARLAAMHRRLDPHLRRLDPRQVEMLVQTAEMWAEAAEIRRSADPARPDTDPRSSRSDPAAGPPVPEAPERGEPDHDQ